jgi:class 3 adenylate cyclase
MSDPNEILEQFLRDYCPNPDLIRPLAKHFWILGKKREKEFLLRSNEAATSCWLITRGRVEITLNGRLVAERQSGDFIGEQAYLQRASGKPVVSVPQADIQATGDGIEFWSINPAFEAEISRENRRDEREVWHQTLAAVINAKLGQAILDRAHLRSIIHRNDDWLDKFADGDALDLVRTAAYDGRNQVRKRDVIVWFSDIASFSKWSEQHKNNPEEIAKVARRLTEIQINRIRQSGGLIDKIQGDGLMAFWFIDAFLKDSVPRTAIVCALDIVKQFRNELETLGLTGSLLDIRIGMHSGTVAFGDFGTSGRIAVTVLGDVVNLASRYESAKREEDPPLGRIRISPDLRNLADRCEGTPIQFSELIEVEVKNKLVIPIFCATEETS